MKSIKKIIIIIITILFGEIIVYLYGDVLKLKEVVKRTKSGFKKDLLLRMYEKRLYRSGSFIGYKCKIGLNPVFPHGIQGIFISNDAVIGNDCVIFQQVTIGSNSIPGHKRQGSPNLGKNCYIGAGAKIIGKLTIGDNCRIGANCVVVKDVPANCVVVQESSRIIQKENLDNKFYIN